jgi:hypothetical protein
VADRGRAETPRSLSRIVRQRYQANHELLERYRSAWDLLFGIPIAVILAVALSASGAPGMYLSLPLAGCAGVWIYYDRSSRRLEK